jgi:hypothetical protein
MSYALDALYSMQQEQQHMPGVHRHTRVLLLDLAALDLSGNQAQWPLSTAACGVVAATSHRSVHSSGPYSKQALVTKRHLQPQLQPTNSLRRRPHVPYGPTGWPGTS